MQVYITYILFLTFLLLLGFFSRDKGKTLEIIVLTIVILFSGLRDYTGYDFVNYAQSYDSGIFDYAFEPGFVAFWDILRLMGANYHVMFFMASLFTYVVMFWAIQRSTQHTRIAFLIYLMIPSLYLNSLSIVRQGMAVPISFLAFSYLLEKKYWTYFLVITLAVMFHYSSAIMLLFHFLGLKTAHRMKTIHYLILILVSLAIATFNLTAILQTVLGGKYVGYAEGEQVDMLKLVVFNGFFLIMIFFNKRLVEKNPNNRYFMFFSVCAVVIINTFSSIITLTRLGYYFRVFEIVLMAEFVYLFTKKSRVLILLLVYSYYFGIFFITISGDEAMIMEGNGPKMTPYQNVLFNSNNR